MKKIRFNLYGKLLCVVLVPLIILSISVAITTHITFLDSVNRVVHSELHNIISISLKSFENRYPGDYHLEQEGEFYFLYKGDTNISEEYDILDEYKKITGYDFTFFFYDTRMLTTITDEKKCRIVGTKAHATVMSAVYEKEEPVFYESVKINNEKYYAYYMPVFNHDGTCIGMMFAGKPSKEIQESVKESLNPILAVTIIMVCFCCLICNSVAKENVLIINRIKHFLQELADGNFKTQLDSRILKRGDELGEMGRFTIRVQTALKEMVERDTLTKLYSRRIGAKMLENTHLEYKDTGTKYCLILCDIDHFKMFNDSYGHECGDLVLQETASIFNHFLVGKGYAIRWGGEEFLLVLENYTLEEAQTELNDLRNRINKRLIEYKGNQLHITLTYGLVSCVNHDDYSEMIKMTDKLLYEGKENGRNCIISEKVTEN